MKYIYEGDCPRHQTAHQAAIARGPIMGMDYKVKGEYRYDRPNYRPHMIILVLCLVGVLAGLASCS